MIHQVVVAYAAGARQGTRAQKLVLKCLVQVKTLASKGTGLLVLVISNHQSGVLVVQPSRLNHKITAKKVNKKMYRGAIKSILSELVRQDRLVVVEKFELDAPKLKY